MKKTVRNRKHRPKASGRLEFAWKGAGTLDIDIYGNESVTVWFFPSGKAIRDTLSKLIPAPHTALETEHKHQTIEKDKHQP